MELPQKPKHTTGPLPFLNPTTRYHPIPPHHPSSHPPPPPHTKTTTTTTTPPPPPPTSPKETTKKQEEIYHIWRSRDNRKGRHALLTPHPSPTARATNTLSETLRGLARMFTRFPIWDVSYDVAVVFTLGSVVWCINGFFVWYPLVAPQTEFPGEVDVGGGWTAFVGATVFEVGSVLLMLEAVNENRTDCFGWAVEEALEDDKPRLHTTPDACRHHHQDKRGWLRRNVFLAPGALAAAAAVPPLDDGVVGHDDLPKESSGRRRQWSWWPSWYELRTHYLREIGFLACLAQMVGATIFWISGFTALPSINSSLSPGALDGVYWLPQVVGGSGFIVSSLLFMLEVQDRWYLPAPKLLGWHVGFWNLIGALGFTLCGALGFALDAGGDAIEYASTLSTFVGSWAFLIGSLFQWYESLDKYPISVGNAPSFLSES